MGEVQTAASLSFSPQELALPCHLPESSSARRSELVGLHWPRRSRHACMAIADRRMHHFAINGLLCCKCLLQRKPSRY